jgi:hypothetical protein
MRVKREHTIAHGSQGISLPRYRAALRARLR